MIEPLEMQFQRRDGLWAELSEDHPVPVWVINPSQKTINVSIDERGEVIVTNWPDTMPVTVTDTVPVQVTNWLDNLTPLVQGIIQRLDSAMYIIDRQEALIKYLIITQGVVALATVATLIIAIVR